MIPERLRWLRLRGRRLLRRSRAETELDAELQFHFDQLVEQFRRDGLPEHEARFAAQREFGAADLYREEVRDTWRPSALADLGRSIRFAVRSLARSPGFTFVAILTLALGIGANTSMFSLLNTVVLKPLPYDQSHELDVIRRTTPNNPDTGISPPDYQVLVSQAEHYGEVAALLHDDLSLAEPGRPAEMAPGARVSANFLSLLRMTPQVGRDFRPEEATEGRHRVLIISDRLWNNRFGGDPGIIGRNVRVNGEPHEIVGVLPKAFNDWRHLGWVDLFRPLGLSAAERTDRDATLLEVFGRRRPDLEPAEAAAYLAGLGDRLAADHPEANAGTAWQAQPLEDTVIDGSGAMIMSMLVGLSGFVLLIACSNLANFLLARTIARSREFALRAALGASRPQLLRPLIVEALVLALAGGVGAILVAVATARWLALRSMGENGESVALALDWRVLAWALLASLLTAVAFGIAPALCALRLNVNDTLKSGARGTTGGRGQRRLGQLLIIGQFALAMTLLAGAALFIRGLDDLNNRRFGWQSDDLISAEFLLPTAAYPDAETLTAFQRLTLERLQALPGVESASLSWHLPFFLFDAPRRYRVEGRSPPEPGQGPSAMINTVSPDYFRTVGTPLLAGRAFTARDRATSPRVFVINQTMATSLFGREDPIGQRLVPAGADPGEPGEIVGVVGDVRSIYPDPVPTAHQLYQPLAQEPRHRHQLAVRAPGVAPAVLVDRIQRLMTELDPDLPVRQLMPANDRIHRANYQLGVLRDMLGSFALLGLGLASLGIYGVIARTMAQRTGEFGIRLALGACVRDITRLVLTAGVRLALAGAALGLLGAFGMAQLLAAGFPGMTLQSGPVIAGATLVLVIVALLASYLPARRAGRISPVEALRAE